MLGKIKQRCKRLILDIFVVAAEILLLSGMTAYAADPSWTSITEGIYQDPVTGDIIYTTIDKERTSDIYYQTIGFDIADAVKDGSGKLTETGAGEIRIVLQNPAQASQNKVDIGGGKIATTWTIPYATMVEQIKSQYPAWYNKIVNPQGEVYLKFDAVLRVFDAGKYGTDRFGQPNPSAVVDPITGEIIGDFWDKLTYEELKTLYGWDPSFFDNHFDKALMIAMGIIEGEEESDVSDEHLYSIGKDKPNFCTYNYDPTGKFNIGGPDGETPTPGIPTSEDITNGYNADEWYGSAFIKQHTASKWWKFGGNISYEKEYHTVDDSGTSVTHKYSVSEPCEYTVKRTVKYWYLRGVWLYDLDTVDDDNEVFPGGNHHFISYIETQVTCRVNGEDMTTTTSYDFNPDNEYHVDWPELSQAERTINVSGSSKSDAVSKFQKMAENRVAKNEEINVRNDELDIRGKQFMSDEWYPYGEFCEGKNNKRSFFEIEEPDYGLEQDEENGTIPSTIANGKYFTSITATYKQIVLNTRTPIEHKKTPDNSTIQERIKEGPYQEDEPVWVHTPTISPVVIADPDTHEQLTEADMKNQLIKSAINEDADYQLLLDGTYTIKFIPSEHFEHIGYPEMAPDLYNKYCKFKQVCFPFTIQLDGKIYDIDNTTMDENGEPKLAGYTQWIDLPDFEVDDFYIPTWAFEGSDYVIQFRVAPENVVDHNGVNHIDDTEYLRNVTLNGEPLYNYVSTYTLTVQVSGIIYDFQAVGVNDRDCFEGFDDESGLHGLGIANYYAFCPRYEEKRSGIYNRLGTPDVRYSVDGTINSNWSIRNTLPFSNGRSLVYPGEGTLRRGNTFAFTIKTIANLYDEEIDEIYIKPTFRYVSLDGTVDEDIDVYYDKENADGTDTMRYVEYGSEKDKSVLKEVSIADIRFDGSYYYDDKLVEDMTGRVIDDSSNYHQDDAEYSKDKCNAYQYEKNHDDIPTWPKEAYKTANNYLSRKTESYCLSGIVLNSRLRLLTGNVEQLARNIGKQGAGLEYIQDKTASGGSYYVNQYTNPELWDRHRSSMQTWFGTYWIPNQLYVTKDVLKADADGDGVEEEYDSVWDYTVAKGYVEGTEDFFMKDGYLIVNFNIMTINNGKPHLVYYGGNADMWQMEGAPDTTTIGDPSINEDIEIPLRSGDVAVIDLSQSIMDRFYAGFNRIN